MTAPDRLAQTLNNTLAKRRRPHMTLPFAVQDDITRNIAIALHVKLAQGESARLWEGQTNNLRAWECMIAARDAFQRYSTADNAIARRLLAAAILIDPAYAGAIALLGISYYWDARYSVSMDEEKSLSLAEQQVAAILDLDPDMGVAYTLRAAVAFMRDQHNEAIGLCQRAVALAPSDCFTLGFLGMFCLYAGDAGKAAISLKTAMRLCPYPESWMLYYYSVANLWLENFGAALEGLPGSSTCLARGECGKQCSLPRLGHPRPLRAARRGCVHRHTMVC